MAAASSSSSASLGLWLRAQQRLLAWTVRTSRDSPRAAEFWGQLLGPVQFPLLRRSLRRAGGSMSELEAVLRPVLVPGEDGRAIAHWHHNNHLRAFARAEFLWRKVVQAQQLPPERLPWEERGEAPAWSELLQAFPSLQTWNREEGTAGREEDRRAELLGALAKGPGWDVSGWSLEDVLEAGGACVVGRGPLNVWCKERGYWEVVTREYVQGLAAYLRGRVRQLRGRGLAHAGVVVEVGAGSGQLAHYLRQELSRQQQAEEEADDGLTYVATDCTRAKRPFTEVERLDYRKAISRYGPAVVLCSWMPWEDDWTGFFRESGCVEEYVLIGEPGCVGDPWLTWGLGSKQQQQGPTPPREQARKSERRSSKGRRRQEGDEGRDPAPYALEGWEREELKALSRHQLSQFDCQAYARNSTTVAFRRRQQGS